MIKVFHDGKVKKLIAKDERFAESNYVDWIWSQFDFFPSSLLNEIQTWDEIEYAGIQLWAINKGLA